MHLRAQQAGVHGAQEYLLCAQHAKQVGTAMLQMQMVFASVIG